MDRTAGRYLGWVWIKKHDRNSRNAGSVVRIGLCDQQYVEYGLEPSY